MSFDTDVRQEISRIPCESQESACAELCAALLAADGIAYAGLVGYKVEFRSASGSIVRRHFNLLKQYLDINGEIRVSKTEALGGRTRYSLTVPPEDSSRLLEALALLDQNALLGYRRAPAEGAYRGEESIRSFLRGAFMICGSVANPEKTYQLEFTAPNEECAQTIAALAADMGIEGKIICRRSRFVVYWKQAEQICDLLTLLGASGAVLRMENIRIQRSMRGQINRQMNCDAFNIDRTMQAAQKQLEDIRFLEREVGFDHLPKSLVDIAQARIEHPDSSLTELGDAMEPPLGKSGVRSRIQRLSELADRLRAGEETGLK
ncbi:MAG: DNA-binding protein WhiA [Clostridia bacterium]|nr:DNA-binding protein WhiA [Clostridia bacterium]